MLLAQRRKIWPGNCLTQSSLWRSFLGHNYTMSTYCLSLLLLLLLLSRFSRVWLCATPETAAHQAPPSLGFSRQEHWSRLPFPSPMHGSEKWKWSCSVVFDSSRPHGLQPPRLLHPWDFPGKSTGVGCHCLLWPISSSGLKKKQKKSPQGKKKGETHINTNIGENRLGQGWLAGEK